MTLELALHDVRRNRLVASDQIGFDVLEPRRLSAPARSLSLSPAQLLRENLAPAALVVRHSRFEARGIQRPEVHRHARTQQPIRVDRFETDQLESCARRELSHPLALEVRSRAKHVERRAAHYERLELAQWLEQLRNGRWDLRHGDQRRRRGPCWRGRQGGRLPLERLDLGLGGLGFLGQDLGLDRLFELRLLRKQLRPCVSFLKRPIARCWRFPGLANELLQCHVLLGEDA